MLFILTLISLNTEITNAFEETKCDGLEPGFDHNGIYFYGHEYVTYAPNEHGIIDMTHIHVYGSLKTILDDMDCKRVTAVDLIVKEDDKDMAILDQQVWDDSLPPYLDVKVGGLDDLCKGHNVILRIHGTKGQTKVETLRHLDAVRHYVHQMMKSKASGYDHDFEVGIENASIVDQITTQTTASVEWKISEWASCIDGYLLELQKANGEIVKEPELIEKFMLSRTWTDLDPCTEYIASVNIYLGEDVNGNPIFVGKKPFKTNFNTLCDQ